MTIISYLKDHWVYVVTQTFFLLMFTAMLELVRTPAPILSFLAIVYVVFAVMYLATDYYKRAKFLNSLSRNLEKIDQKYLILDTIECPDYLEGRMIFDDLYQINKSMNEHVKGYKENVNHYKDYIEMWVHEVKLPLSSLSLIIHNMKAGEETTRKLREQLMRLDNYADQILYYVRSETASADYQFCRTSLKSLVSAVAQRNRTAIQEKDISLKVHDLGYEVITDSKWMEFMVNQILDNAMKYMKPDEAGEIEIYAEEAEGQITLHIKDNGIGISERDLPRLFEKSFTGDNGRVSAKSTGMGLYIVKKLCDQMGHRIRITSKKGEYTNVSISIGTFTL